ncbi:hypothetical protein MKQ68_12135 [Chitinophaga horti]|uniref:Outer membrane protein beta-barrel domain-containing protein n=1 Tax=Chitinophaga horti TaxID=2920382 RepID=A0ABY6JC21_9BACT|nr:hypothetical protein [Chitinophaga horti]UYQ95849.1 hypothetical protein MKQ68_12135 [Chitinophaga horti]
MKHLLLIGCLFTSLAATAQKATPVAPWFVERFKITGGYFMADNNTNVKVSNNEFLGTAVNLENDLGFDDKVNTFLAGFEWRASNRSRIDFSYTRLHRSSVHQLQKTIQFGDNTYNVNALTDSYFDTDIFRASYGYAILQGLSYEAGIMVGAHVIKSQMGIAVTGAGAGVDVKDDFDVTAPLPNAGIWAGYAITGRLAVTGDISYMSLSVNDLHGRILTGGVQVKLGIFSGLSATAGYSMMHLNLDGQRDGLLGDVDWKYNGPSISLSYAFGNKRWVN